MGLRNALAYRRHRHGALVTELATKPAGQQDAA
jgi:hypothetical protein